MTKTLLHVCCAPCTIHPLSELRREGLEVEGFFYNPNIHPYLEWLRRKETMEDYARSVELPVEVREGYDLGDFLRRTAPIENDRCGECYAIRLEQAAKYASEKGFDAYTTTLLVSPYQQHQLVCEAGEKAGAKYGIPFLYRDFRGGFRNAQAEAKALGLYRQPYCGCIFSERDRYQKPRRTGGNP
jgi:predicted adenine nucleotide alpha hydrolase (AANH) superfamily ATPase